MKKTILAVSILVMLFSFRGFGQTNEWTWVKGDSTEYNDGIYGTRGVPSATNKPGSRLGGVTWRDLSGNLWLFGGLGLANNTLSVMNDLWRYNPISNEWTWISGSNTTDDYGVYGTKGVASPYNKPGARRLSVGWRDLSGNLWLLGGDGYDLNSDYGFLNDLWKYDINTNQWTWVNGNEITAYEKGGIHGIKGVSSPINKPSYRWGSVSWSDAQGNFWLFGGEGMYILNGFTYQGYLNDLWKYNVSTNQWTWIKGDSVENLISVYGGQGVSSQNYNPKGRRFSTSWSDNSNNLWLFGGSKSESSISNNDFFNDLWKYNIATNEWAWMKGNIDSNRKGFYGTQGIAASNNKPGARTYGVPWKDNTGNLWLFGGFGYPTVGFGDLNDLWKYDVTTNEWTWMKGDYSTNAQGHYGTKGISSFLNKPGARESAYTWNDASGNFWLFGGGHFNDLWKYIPPSSCIPNTWTGAVNAVWNNPANWSCNVVPTSGNNVTIPVASNYPSLSSYFTIGNLTLQGILNLNGQILTLNGAISGGGTISGSATSNLIINGNAGTIKFTAGAAILNSLQINSGGSANVSSNLVITGH